MNVLPLRCSEMETLTQSQNKCLKSLLTASHQLPGQMDSFKRIFFFPPQFFLQLQQDAVSLADEEEGVLGGLGMTEVGRLASLEGSLFEGLLALLERLRGDMLGRLLDAVMRDVKEKAQAYRQDRSVPYL